MATQNPSRATRLAAGAFGTLLGKLIGFVLLLLIIKAIAAVVGGVSWTAAAVLAGCLIVLSALRPAITALLFVGALRARRR